MGNALGIYPEGNTPRPITGNAHFSSGSSVSILYRPDTITHAWIKQVRKIGLRGIRLHDARHSHASLMLKQGVHPKIVQERLGHSNIQLTLDTYSHIVPGLQEAAAMNFDKEVFKYSSIA
ncbi:tyrosine-type recombinase/integrase [Chloroflexota bacterium]